MNKNVVDDFGDDYFMNEYRNGLYIHNNRLYQLKGFNINGVSRNGDTSREVSQYVLRESFSNIESLQAWIVKQRARVERLLEEEPEKYYQVEDEDGDLYDSEDTSEDWEDWQDEVNKAKDILEEAEAIERNWDNETAAAESEVVCLEFTPLSDTTEKQLLIKVEEFTSLKGFSLKQGYINVSDRLFNISCRRCYKINNDTAKMIRETPKAAEQFLNPTYPTLREAVEILRTNSKMEAIAISRRVCLVKELHYTTSKNYTVKWRLNGSEGEDIAFWGDGDKTLWARNNKILGYLNKKG